MASAPTSSRSTPRSSRAGRAIPAAGYAQLQAAAGNYPHEIAIQLALGQLLTRMPPDHDRLSERLAAYRDFDQQDLGPDQAAEFQALQAKIQNELDTYDRLLAQLNQAKEGPAAMNSRIEHLQNQIAEDQRRIASAQNVNSTVNSITGFFHQRVTVVDVSAKQDEIARDQAEINQDQAAEQSPQGNVQAAQQQFDSFCAGVPW